MNFKDIRKSLLRRKVFTIRVKGNKINYGDHHIQEIENTKRDYYPFDIHFADYIPKGKYYRKADTCKYLSMMDIVKLYYDGVLFKGEELLNNQWEYFIIKLKEGRL